MVGGLGGGGKGRKGGGGYPPGSGPLSRPSSVGDFNEVEEENWNINQMPDHEVLTEFEKMLENMNLSEVSNREKKSGEINRFFLVICLVLCPWNIFWLIR